LIALWAAFWAAAVVGAARSEVRPGPAQQARPHAARLRRGRHARTGGGSSRTDARRLASAPTRSGRAAAAVTTALPRLCASRRAARNSRLKARLKAASDS
jgi:hypothetical protein